MSLRVPPPAAGRSKRMAQAWQAQSISRLGRFRIWRCSEGMVSPQRSQLSCVFLAAWRTRCRRAEKLESDSDMDGNLDDVVLDQKRDRFQMVFGGVDATACQSN